MCASIFNEAAAKDFVYWWFSALRVAQFLQLGHNFTVEQGGKIQKSSVQCFLYDKDRNDSVCLSSLVVFIVCNNLGS